MAALCDLHTHSVFSDGTLTPEQLIDEAVRIGLTAIALTDHNTTAGLATFLAAASGKPITAIPGIEFSTDYQGIELHILGLFLKQEHYAPITELLEDFHRRKYRSYLHLLDALEQAGYKLDRERLFASAQFQINRAHIAAELIRQGYFSEMQEVFRGPLSPKNGLYRPALRPGAPETVRLIKSMGAVAVLAHPLLSTDEATLRSFLTEAVPCGLDGMETIYSTYDDATTRTAMGIAEEFGLLHSGGSDFHGGNKPDIQLGTGRGNLHIPEALYRKLQERAR